MPIFVHKTAMSDISYDYSKKRKDFCLPIQLTDSPTTLLHTLEPSKKEKATWAERFATTVEVDCMPEVADEKVSVSACLEFLK